MRFNATMTGLKPGLNERWNQTLEVKPRRQGSLGHVLVLDPDVAFAEWSLLEFVKLNFHATAVKHLCHFAKILVHAAQAVEHLLMKFLDRHWRTGQALHRLQTNLQTPVNRLVFIAADLKRIQL